MIPPLRLSPRLITVNRSAFELVMWRLRKTYKYEVILRRSIAIGKIGYETPTGVYFVDAKNETPDWKAPDADWVPEDMRGKIISYEDPRNPFAGGFVSLAASEGIGIHGTRFVPELGTQASHGCIRMSVDAIVKLMKYTALGTPVFIYD